MKLKKLTMLSVLAAIAAFCLAPGLALAETAYDFDQSNFETSSSDSVYTITESGTYNLVGDANGRIVVTAPANGLVFNVTINLGGHSLTNGTSGKSAITINSEESMVNLPDSITVTINGDEGNKVSQTTGSTSEGDSSSSVIYLDAKDASDTGANVNINKVNAVSKAGPCVATKQGNVAINNSSLKMDGSDNYVLLADSSDSEEDSAITVNGSTELTAASGNTPIVGYKGSQSQVILNGGTYNKIPFMGELDEGTYAWQDSGSETTSYLVGSDKPSTAINTVILPSDVCKLSAVWFDTAEAAKTFTKNFQVAGEYRLVSFNPNNADESQTFVQYVVPDGKSKLIEPKDPQAKASTQMFAGWYNDEDAESTEPYNFDQYVSGIVSDTLTLTAHYEDIVATNTKTGKNYTSLQAALEDVKPGEAINLKKDVVLDEALSLSNESDNAITINLKGHTISGSDAITPLTVSAGKWLIKNGTVKGAGTSQEPTIYVSGDSSDLTLQQLTVTSCSNHAVQVDNGKLHISGSDNEFKNEGAQDKFAAILAAQAGGASVPELDIEGGEFDGSSTSNSVNLNPANLSVAGGTFPYDIFKGGDSALEISGGEFGSTANIASVVDGYSMLKQKGADAYYEVVKTEAAKKVAEAYVELSAEEGGYTLYFEDAEEAAAYAAEHEGSSVYKYVDVTIAQSQSATYNGKAQLPEITYSGIVEGDEVEPTIEYTGDTTEGKAVNAGKYSIKVAGFTAVEGVINQYNYVPRTEESASFRITPLDITDAKLSLKAKDALTYNGEKQTQEFEYITVGEGDDAVLMTEGSYKLEGNTQKDAGTYDVTVTGSGNFTGTNTVEAAFTIATLDISKCEIVEVKQANELTYNGKNQTQKIDSVVVMAGEKEITVPSSALDLSGNVKKDAGTYTMTIAGTGNFTGSIDHEFTIEQLSIKDAKVYLGEKLTYNGKDQTQEIDHITAGDEDTIVDLDSLEITNRVQKDAGTYTMQISAQEGTNFKGETTCDFTIRRLSIKDAIVTLGKELTYNGSKQEQTVESVVVGEGEDAVNVDFESLEFAGNILTDAGAHLMTIKAKSDTNFCDSTKITYVINALNLEKAKVQLTKTDFIYNGKVQKPGVASVVLNDRILKDGLEFTTTYVQSKNVGTYQVVITGNGYGYTGKITASYTINPTAVGGFTLTKAKKAFKVKWSKFKADRSGVQISYSTKKSMKNAKTVTVKGSSSKAKTVKKLKKKTKYYVKVRSYKTVGGKTYYSSWSKVKTVKTK